MPLNIKDYKEKLQKSDAFILQAKERVILEKRVKELNDPLQDLNFIHDTDKASLEAVIASPPSYSFVLHELFTEEMESNPIKLLSFLAHFYPDDWEGRYKACFGEEDFTRLITEINCVGDTQDPGDL